MRDGPLKHEPSSSFHACLPFVTGSHAPFSFTVALMVCHSQLTLDSYASVVFGKVNSRVEAWVCPDKDVDETMLDSCKQVMHDGELVWACVLEEGNVPAGNWESAFRGSP